MTVYYHEQRGETHLLKTSEGEEVFRGEEHQLVTRTFRQPGDRYKSYRDQRVMTVPEFLEYLRASKKAESFGARVFIPNSRKAGEARKKGRSVD